MIIVDCPLPSLDHRHFPPKTLLITLNMHLQAPADLTFLPYTKECIKLQAKCMQTNCTLKTHHLNTIQGHAYFKIEQAK